MTGAGGRCIGIGATLRYCDRRGRYETAEKRGGTLMLVLDSVGEGKGECEAVAIC